MSIDRAECATLAPWREGAVLHITLNCPDVRKVAATKAPLAKARLCTPAAPVQEAAAVFARAAAGADGLEGTSAFLEKRRASRVPS